MLNTTMTAIIERLKGTTILINVVHFDAPSMSAASIISCMSSSFPLMVKSLL